MTWREPPYVPPSPAVAARRKGAANRQDGALHPAPAERDGFGYSVFGYPTGETMSRDQVIRPEETLEVTLDVQDVERLLAADPDPELRKRVEEEIRHERESTYEAREWG